MPSAQTQHGHIDNIIETAERHPVARAPFARLPAHCPRPRPGGEVSSKHVCPYIRARSMYACVVVLRSALSLRRVGAQLAQG